MRHRIALAAILVVLSAATGSHPAAAITGPFSLTVSAGDLSAGASLRSYCPQGGSGAPCVSSQLDSTPRSRLPVRPRQTLRLTLPADDPAARRVTVTLGRPGRADPERAVNMWTKRATGSDADGHRWRVKLPRRVRDATFVSIRIAYTGARPPAVNGSAQFVTGTRLACARG